jgi:hypothetical protein
MVCPPRTVIAGFDGVVGHEDRWPAEQPTYHQELSQPIHTQKNLAERPIACCGAKTVANDRSPLKSCLLQSVSRSCRQTTTRRGLRMLELDDRPADRRANDRKSGSDRRSGF